MISPPTSHLELFDWLRLIRSENVGPIAFYRLLEKFGSASQALKSLSEDTKKIPSLRTIKIAPKKDIEDELQAIEKNSAQLITRGDAAYPRTLESLPDAPPVLSVLGDIDLLSEQSIAIVGARNASLNGKKFAYNLARELGKEKYIIVSGLARGIDTQAHTGAIKSYKTIAVVAGGANIIYPSENKSLYERIASEGAIVSETAWGLQPQAKHFPRRNRLVSALSKGVVVVEAALKSGSLITARFALEQGRDVFAVPGSPLGPRCRGTNNLLRNGAVVTEGITDILENLPSFERPSTRTPLKNTFNFDSVQIAQPATPDTEHPTSNLLNNVIENLSYSAIGVDELIRQCQTSPQEVLNILSELELEGKVERHANNKVSLTA